MTGGPDKQKDDKQKDEGGKNGGREMQIGVQVVIL
jgi:hypothetical protein